MKVGCTQVSVPQYGCECGVPPAAAGRPAIDHHPLGCKYRYQPNDEYLIRIKTGNRGAAAALRSPPACPSRRMQASPARQHHPHITAFSNQLKEVPTIKLWEFYKILILLSIFGHWLLVKILIWRRFISLYHCYCYGRGSCLTPSFHIFPFCLHSQEI